VVPIDKIADVEIREIAKKVRDADDWLILDYYARTQIAQDHGLMLSKSYDYTWHPKTKSLEILARYQSAYAQTEDACNHIVLSLDDCPDYIRESAQRMPDASDRQVLMGMEQDAQTDVLESDTTAAPETTTPPPFTMGPKPTTVEPHPEVGGADSDFGGEDRFVLALEVQEPKAVSALNDASRRLALEVQEPMAVSALNDALRRLAPMREAMYEQFAARTRARLVPAAPANTIDQLVADIRTDVVDMARERLGHLRGAVRTVAGEAQTAAWPSADVSLPRTPSGRNLSTALQHATGSDAPAPTTPTRPRSSMRASPASTR
jgi:hypothetical protein